MTHNLFRRSVALISLLGALLASCTLPTLELKQPDEPVKPPDLPGPPSTAGAVAVATETPMTLPQIDPVVPTQVVLDPCAMDNGGCDVSPMAQCTNVNLAAQCACPEGYEGNGKGENGCTPMRTCAKDNGGCDTSPMASCSEPAPNEVSCACPGGYTGNGLGVDGCTDIDECVTNNGGCDTSPKATCTNTVGGRTCTCPSGSSGDGASETGCVDTDECATNNGGCDTSPMATCHNGVNGRTCSCPSGYSGTGVGTSGCSDTNECLSGNGGCDTAPMATCTNTPGSRTCRCPSGYMGTGIGGSGCADINECATNNGGCDTAPMATCTNTPGGRECTCPSGTGTELSDGAETDAPGNIQCDRFWTKGSGVWDYVNRVTWEYGTQATYEVCRGMYHNRTDGVLGEACTLAEARTYCANFSTVEVWRVPTFTELSSIADTTLSPSLRTEKFGPTPKTHFWSTSSDDSTLSFYVDFNTGSLGVEAPTMQHDVRCVIPW